MKASCSDNYFVCLFRRSLFWLLLVSSPFFIVQCGGGGGGGGGGGEEEGIDGSNLVMVDQAVSAESAAIGDSLMITLTVRNQGTVISGGDGEPQEVTFYRSENRFVGGPGDEKLGTYSFGTLEPNAESNQSFSFQAMSGDNYYGACFGTSNNCQIGIKVSVSSPEISGSSGYTDSCELSRADRSTFTISGSVSAIPSYGSTFSSGEESVVQGDQKYYLLKLKRKEILSIWTTGSSDMVATLFDGDCNAISGYYYAEDGGIGGDNNFQIEATASAGYYFLVLHEKSLGEATFQIKVRLLTYRPLLVGADPLEQWHLDNTDGHIDINVLRAWEITRGDSNVLVNVIDDGTDVSHPDLVPNHDDRYQWNYASRSHGTAVAGLIVAAGNNGIGVSGVAPEVGFTVQRSSGSRTYSEIMDALIRHKEKTAISNNSWGFSTTYFKPAFVAHDLVVEEGTINGYGGKGIFYAFAAGNLHRNLSSANYGVLINGYTTAAICAVSANGKRSGYSEMGANLWICAPSNDNNRNKGLTTTALGGGYTELGGTSAAAPIVSGVAALMRSANPDLGWRDIRLILAATAQKNDSDNLGWFEGVASYNGRNYSGKPYQHSHEYGFGLVDAGAAVSKSVNWNNVGEMVVSSSQSKDVPINKQQIPIRDIDGKSSFLKVTDLNDTLDFIEYIHVAINLDGKAYGDLQIELTSPADKTSILAVERVCGACIFKLPTDIRLGSARHLGESPDGDWTLKVVNDVIGGGINNIYSWGLKFYGHKKP